MTAIHPPRHVRIVRDRQVQAIEIPPEFELPGTEATIRKVGDWLIIEPMHQKMGLAALLDSWGSTGEDLGEIDDPPPVTKDIF